MDMQGRNQTDGESQEEKDGRYPDAGKDGLRQVKVGQSQHPEDLVRIGGPDSLQDESEDDSKNDGEEDVHDFPPFL